MLNKLPNGETIVCPLIQMRRVWEIWSKLENPSPYDVAMQPDGQYIAVRNRNTDCLYQVLPNAEVWIQGGGATNWFPEPPPLLPQELRDSSAAICEKLFEDMLSEWRSRFHQAWHYPWAAHGRV